MSSGKSFSEWAKEAFPDIDFDSCYSKSNFTDCLIFRADRLMSRVDSDQLINDMIYGSKVLSDWINNKECI